MEKFLKRPQCKCLRPQLQYSFNNNYHFIKKNEINTLVQTVYTAWVSVKFALSHALLARD